MFSGNHKISPRQLYRNYAICLISLSALLPPLVMNRESISSIGIALVFLGIYLAASAVVPRPESGLVKGICYAHYWLLGTMAAHMTGLLIREFLLTDTAIWVVLGWFYLFCYYNLYKGLECRIRVSEILFPFFLFLLLLLSVLMHGEVETGRLWELKLSFRVTHLQTGYELFCWLGAVQSLWHLHGQLKNEGDWGRAVRNIWLTGAAVTIGWSLFTYCVYGNAGHTGLVFPLASAMTLAHFPGNVIGRLDALFIFAWLIGLFLLCSSLFAPLTDREPDRRRKYLLFALLAASYAAACRSECMEWGPLLLYYVFTPVEIFLLVWYGIRGKEKKIVTACLVLLPMFLLSGCSGQELEQQSLVTAVSVDVGETADFRLTFGFGNTQGEDEDAEEEDTKEEDGKTFVAEADSFQEARERYWEYYRKNMDFNHLKNFYFSRELLMQESFSRLLEEIQIHGAYSRGTLVYATENEASGESRKEDQLEEGVPVHRLLNARYNNESCKIPAVRPDGRYKGSVSWPYSE